MLKTYQKEGSHKHLIISLHGTGGSGDSLFSLSEMLDPKASFVGIEGDVLEHGYRRYFKRYPNGTFHLRSLAEESTKLHKTLLNVIKEYKDYEITLIGYSNGANIFLNILKEFDDVELDHIILYHPSKVRPDVAYKAQNTPILITYGADDPYVEQADFITLETDLKAAGYDVKTVMHQFGHQLIEEEIIESKAFLGDLS